MNRMKLRRVLGAAIFMGMAIIGVSAWADPPQGHYAPGYGMGPGMIGGPASCRGMGSDAIGDLNSRADLNLTAEQRRKIGKIEADTRHEHWELMGRMQDQESQMIEQFNSEQRDDAALSKTHRDISDLRNQMFDLALRAEKQIDAVLTDEQRAKVRQDD